MSANDRKLNMEELGRISPSAYAEHVGRGTVVVLDDVRSRHNVGSIFRTADAFGVARMVLCGFTPLPPHREIEKTALGATESVPWIHVPTARDAVEALRAEGYRILALEQTVLARPLPSFVSTGDMPLALVFGNELHGVSDEVVVACDEALVIPQVGTKHSLNVAVCAGVALWWLAGRHTGS